MSTLIEDLLELLDKVYERGYDCGAADAQSGPDGARGFATGPETAQTALEALRSEISACLSYGDDNQVEDPRSRWIDVQANKEFYDWYTRGGR